MKRIVGIVAAALVASAAAASSAAASQELPDLGMAPLKTIYIDTTTMPGHKLLRYDSELVNVGAGPLELIGTRPDTSTPDMSVVQRIYDSSGTYTDSPVNTVMFYASAQDHNHWHTQDVEGGTLTRLDNGHQVGSLAKHGFCFSDGQTYNLTLPGAPARSVYTDAGCEPLQPDALTADMGLSVGWGDLYKASVNLQWIDITGLSNGKYLLTATADPGDVLFESTYANNSAWAKLKIVNNKVTVLQYGPGA